VFADLTAAYYTVWHRGLTCKLLQLLPDKHMVHVIIEMVSKQQKKQVTTPQARRPTGICPGAPSL